MPDNGTVRRARVLGRFLAVAYPNARERDRALRWRNWLGHVGWVWPFPRILGRCIHAGQAMIAIVGSCKNGESRYPGRYLAPNSLPTDCRIPAGHRLDADRAGGPIQSLGR